MRNGIGKQTGRLVLAVGLVLGLAGCVVYPAGPGYYHPYRACCWYYR